MVPTKAARPAVSAPQVVPAPLTREQELKPFRSMLLIRRFEERAGQMYGMGLIGGFCHLYIGQEAVVVGMQMAIEEGDQVITGYRDHGHMLACGMDPKGVMAELTGRRDRLLARQGRLDAHVLPREGTSSAATASSAPRCRSAPASPSPTATARTTASASPISATAPPIRARSTRASTWRSCGSCRSIYVIENNRYAMGTSVEPLLGADRFLQARRSRSTFPASRSTAWTCAR